MQGWTHCESAVATLHLLEAHTALIVIAVTCALVHFKSHEVGEKEQQGSNTASR